MVTLCTVRTMGRPLLRCWAALRRPLATATWWATCQVWRVAWHAGWLGPWVASVAMAAAASMRAVARPACLVEILDGDGPGGLRRLLAFGWVQGGSDPDVHRARGQLLSRRRRAEQVEARAALAYAGDACGHPVADERCPGALVG